MQRPGVLTLKGRLVVGLNDAIMMVEKFENLWTAWPHDTVHELERCGKAHFRAFIEVDGKQLWTELIVGPRGGISEQYVVVDPRQRILVDQLVACKEIRGRMYPDGMYSLVSMRSRSQGRAHAAEICRTAMTELLAALKRRDPQALFRLHHLELESESVRAISGGLPGTARHGDGAGGHH
jgi:hypothetical protein